MDPDFKKRLERAVGKDSVETEIEGLQPHKKQMGRVPEAVVNVKDSRHASKVVKLANRFRVPFVFADSSGLLTKGENRVKRGFVLNFASMNRIKETRILDLLCVAGPGVTLDDLGSALKPCGFFFPPDPGGSGGQSLGRVVMDNAPFPAGIKYGATRDYVLGVEVVTPTGEVVALGSTTLKNSSGLQIERFFAGTSGMLGFPTEITVAVKPLPAKRSLCTASFDSRKKGLEAVGDVLGSGVTPASLEMMDRAWARTCAVLETMSGGIAFLLVELDGHATAVKRGTDVVSRICRRAGALSVSRTSDTKKIEKWRRKRRSIEGFVSEDGTLAMSMVVPSSQVAETLDQIGRIGKKHNLTAGTWGFFLGGNFHMVMAAAPGKRKSTEETLAEVYNTVSSLGGATNCSEMIGFSHSKIRTSKESSLDRVSLAIKKALDPNEVLGAGRRSHRKAVQS